jgi:hypothetical protein
MHNMKSVSLQPTLQTPQSIPPQICIVSSNAAVLSNPSEDIWLIKKKTNFLAVLTTALDPHS